MSKSREVRGGRRVRVALTAVVVLVSYGVVGFTAPARASLSSSTFEIDPAADLVVNGAGTDWLAGGTGTAMRAGTLVRPDVVTASADDSFGNGTSEDDAVPSVIDGSIPPSKDNLTNFGVYVENTAYVLDLFWTRDNNNGDANMDFEFNQSALTMNKPLAGPQIIPVRTDKDLLITYELKGSVATIRSRSWDAASGTWGAAQVPTAAQAKASINTSTLPAAETGGLGPLAPGQFGEASIDLLSLLPDPATSCVTYGSAYLKSRASGSSFNAEMKDFIAPEPVRISNCGSVTIHKTDNANPPAALQGATFGLYAGVPPALTAVAGATCTTSATGDCVVNNVHPGTYTVRETAAPAGYDPAPDQQVVVTGGGSDVSVSFVDPVQTGTITVVKDAVPNDAQDFTFTIDGTPFSLDDDSDATLPRSRDFTVPVGSHSVAETNVPSPWALTGLVCTGGGTPDVATASVAVSIVKGQRVTCTFTNEPGAVRPGLATTAAPAGGGGWVDEATVTGDGTHPVAGTIDFFACAPAATAAGCAPGAGTKVGSTVTVSGGAARTSVPWVPSGAGWTCFRAVFTSSSAFYSDAEHTNTGSECFLKRNADLTVSKTAVAAFGRHYTWSVTKDVDQSTLAVPAGSTATSNYTVKVSNTFVDSAWTVSGTITVTNPNTVPFPNVDVTDAIDNGPGSCAVTNGADVTIPAGGRLDLGYVCTYTSRPSPAQGTNTATATWSAATAFTVNGTATGQASVDFSGVTPSTTDEIATVTDSATGVLGTLDARTAANPTTYTYAVDRSGRAGTCQDFPNTATAVADDSETTTSASASVKVCVGADLTAGVTAEATRDRDHLWTLTKDVDATRITVPAVDTAVATYRVTVTPGATVDSNQALTGLVTATNPNDWEAVSATLTVTTDLPATCAVTDGVAVSVPAAGALTRAYTCTFTSPPSGNGLVTAAATWSAAAARTPHGSAQASTDATFRTVRETSATVTVVDDKTDPAHPVTLGTRSSDQGPTTYDYQVTLPGVVGTCTPYTNTAWLAELPGTSATRTVTVCVGADLTVSKTALATDRRTYLWTLTKDVDRTTASVPANGSATFAYTVTATPAGTTDDGWAVSGQITVSNPNDWQAVTADVTDSLDTGGAQTCTFGGSSQVTVPPSGSVTLTYSCTFGSRPSDGTNTATATWSAAAASTPRGSASGTAPVVFAPSSQTNQTVSVVDDKTDPARPVTLGTATYSESPTVFRYTLDVPATAGTCVDRTNTAVIAQTQQSASTKVTVCSGSDLAVVPTAAGSYDRDHLWTISKAVDRTSVTATEGTAVVFTYTVTATPAGVSDSGYDLAGTVTATNPNDWEAVVADLGITTDLGGDPTCAVTDGTGRSVPAGGSVTASFACTFGSTPALTGTVTATATWDAAAAATPTGTASAAAGAALVLDQSRNATVTVQDDVASPGHEVELGTATWADGPAAFTYPVTRTARGSGCASFTNTATIVETEQQAQQTAELCSEFTGGGGGVTVEPPTGGGGGLAFTGDMNGVLLRWGLGLLLAGAVLLLGSRRRQA